MSSLDAAIYNEARKARVAAEANDGSQGPTVTTPFFQSGTWVAPQNGVLEMRAMSGAGAGAKQASATGGYSGAWGAKTVRVQKDDVVTVAIGAGGVGVAALGNGAAGSATTITHNGITRTVPGGPGGIGQASGVPVVPNGPALPAGDWDIGAASVKPGEVDGITGGAGVDILAQGNNATTSEAAYGSSGAGTGGPGNGPRGGGAFSSPVALRGADANGQLPSGAGTYLDASDGEWVISFYGGGGSITASLLGGNGGGGASGGGTANGGKGGNGGGGGATWSNFTSGGGGIGGGGGANAVGVEYLAGSGGPGYACLRFTADKGV